MPTAGLARLEHLYSVANAEASPIDIDAVRVDDVTHCYMALRQLDSRNSASRKFIVLDLSTSYAVQTVLKQVASCLLTSEQTKTQITVQLNHHHHVRSLLVFLSFYLKFSFILGSLHSSVKRIIGRGTIKQNTVFQN